MKKHTPAKKARVTREQIIDGETTAGPLAVLLVKNPVLFWTGLVFLIFPTAMLVIWFLNQI